MLNPLQLLRITAVALAIPVVCFPAAISVNGACVLGSCTMPDSVIFGQELASSFGFNASVGSDTYRVTGSYDTGYDSIGTFLNFYPTVTYTGSALSSSNDTINVNIFQSFFDDSPGTWDGNYTETIPLSVAVGSTGSAQAFYDGQGLGLVGPFGAGTHYGQINTNLTGLDGNVLAEEYSFVFTFAAGTQPGSFSASPAPEPSQLSFLVIAGSALLAMRNRIKRQLGG